ncbi:abc transporter g family member [Anaeramoeba flamelloides]|uniref:Abc transporter g family member n=1 Tax=Anaeramoeba flamelloides TaxID=1746091 RepID=A0AAV8ABS8_9EUKA|nr:abc transporter g family member [Anaeramoeba flamelloides]
MKISQNYYFLFVILSFFLFRLAAADNENEKARYFLIHEYDKEVCVDNDPDEYPSWCPYKNVIFVPQNVSNKNIRQDKSAIIDSCTPTGDSLDWYDDCNYVDSYTFGVGLKYNEPADPKNYYATHYYDGMVTVTDLNLDLEKLRTYPFGEGNQVDIIEALKLNFTTKTMVWGLAKDDTVRFHYADISGYYQEEANFNLTISGTIFQLIPVIVGPDGDSSTKFFGIYYKDTRDIKKIDFYEFFEDNDQEPALKMTITLKIDSDIIVKGVDAVGTYDDSDENDPMGSDEASDRNPILFFSNKTHFWASTWSETSYTLDFEDSVNTTLFYTLEDGVEMIDFIPFSEYFRKSKNLTQINQDEVSRYETVDPYDGNILWLAIALTDANQKYNYDNMVLFVQLPEFRNFIVDPPATNPANIQDTEMCGSNLYYNDDGECQERPTKQLEIDFIIDQMSYGFKTSPEDEDEENDSSTSEEAEDNEEMNEFYNNNLYHMLTLHEKDTNEIHLHVVQESLGDGEYQKSELDFHYMRKIITKSKVNTITFSENTQHLLWTVKRKYWEIVSADKLIEICDLFRNGEDNEFLWRHQERCEDLPEIFQLDSNFFGQYGSPCPEGTYCPHLSFISYLSPANGYYTAKASITLTCEVGYFCRRGLRVDCPLGYICPEEEMSLPDLCSIPSELNETCADISLKNVEPCDNGSYCIVPYYPALPVPPGTWMERPRPEFEADNLFQDCKEGDWCGLGRSVEIDDDPDKEEILCPANCYCTTSDVLKPVICDCSTEGCSYCPIGTSVEVKCPAGYYCQMPDTKEECFETQYCPAGSVTTESCSAGYYCPDPTKQIKCPEGYYCSEGSTEPTQCSGWVSCPEGTESQESKHVGVIVDLVILIVLLGGYWLAMRFVDKRRKTQKISRQLKIDKQSVLSGLVFSSISLGEGEINATSLWGNTTEIPKLDFFLDFRFENLGLRIKGRSGKIVLKGVTGQIRHGRVTAIMGPSGAGKTTFLNTLCGKASYGIPSGLVEINGVEEPITEYKKVVGFVPQEDIMLRTLTVKENMMNSAKLRLPKEYTHKQIKLTVNQCIKTLGLFDVRHSPIGDETKRGVSGGQRKRVNCGLEMVISPVAIFLDEPTSGLDSTSAMSLCRALQLSAEEDLNIMAVIHQPRYEIFTMFTYVLLLGKGGRTVYLGPTRFSHPYFEFLGFKCPEHVNPADWMMDIIAGNEKIVGSNEKFDPKQLFEDWVNIGVPFTEKAVENDKPPKGNIRDYTDENGNVKLDFVNNDNDSSSSDSSSDDDSSNSDIELNEKTKKKKSTKKYKISPKELRRAKDGRERKTPGFFRQFCIFFTRSLIQQSRDLKGFIIDMVLVYIVGFFLGVLNQDSPYIGPVPDYVISLCPDYLKDTCAGPQQETIGIITSVTILAIALTGGMSSLKIFGPERVNYWREASTGINTIAYFLGKDLSSLVGTVIHPLIFLTIFYPFLNPRGSLGQYYGVLLLIQYTATGIGMAVSTLFPPSVSQLAAIVVLLVFSMVSGFGPPMKEMQEMVFFNIFHYIDLLRYGQEALFCIELEEYKDMYDLTTTYDSYGYDPDRIGIDLFILFIIGVYFRGVAYFFLRVVNRDKQK